MKLSKYWILLNTFVLVMLGSSVALNFLLYSQVRKYYFELNATRLDPMGVSYYPANSQETTKRDRPRIVFLGDSRAASWPSPDINGYEFINRGIGSQTSIQVSERFDQHVRPLKPDIIVIQVGINDLKTIALFPDHRDAIVANCKANITRMVEASKRLGATVIITTIFPAGEVPLARKPFWSDAIGQAVKEVNAYIVTLAGDRTIVVDAFSLLADSQGVMVQKYAIDELHLNEQGYTILNQELVKRIDDATSKKPLKNLRLQ